MSCPASIFSISAASATLRVIGPIVSNDSDTGYTPYRLTRPNVGLSPTIPLYEEGRTIEPPVCDPSAAGNIPTAAPTADPLLEPPGVCAAFHGLTVGAGSPHANSVVTVLPIIIAPARFSSATVVAS